MTVGPRWNPLVQLVGGAHVCTWSRPFYSGQGPCTQIYIGVWSRLAIQNASSSYIKYLCAVCDLGLSHFWCTFTVILKGTFFTVHQPLSTSDDFIRPLTVPSVFLMLQFSLFSGPFDNHRSYSDVLTSMLDRSTSFQSSPWTESGVHNNTGLMSERASTSSVYMHIHTHIVRGRQDDTCVWGG